MPSIASVRKNFARAIDDASRGEVVPIMRRGKTVAAIVPISMARLIEQAEDAVLAEVAEAALKRAKKSGYVFVGDARSLSK